MATKKVRRIYYHVTEQGWDHVAFDKEDCDEYRNNNDAIAHATKLIRAGRPFVFVPHDPVTPGFNKGLKAAADEALKLNAPLNPKDNIDLDVKAASDDDLAYNYCTLYERVHRFECGTPDDEEYLRAARKELRLRGFRVSQGNGVADVNRY